MGRFPMANLSLTYVALKGLKGFSPIEPPKKTIPSSCYLSIHWLLHRDYHPGVT